MRLASWIGIWMLGTGLAVANAAQPDAIDALIVKIGGSDIELRIQAIDAIAKMGPRGRTAVPGLSKAVLLAGDSETRWRAARTLAAIGTDAGPSVPALMQALQDKDPMVRAYAAHALGKIGTASKEAIPELMRRAMDPNRIVSREAQNALLSLKAPPEAMLPLLFKSLEDAEPIGVIAAMGYLTAQGKSIVPKLSEALENEQVSFWACLVIEQIGPEAKETVPQLTNCLERSEPELRIGALMALAAIGAEAKSAQVKVMELLKQETMAGIQIAAAYALGRIGDEQAQVALEQAANSKDLFLQLVAFESLIKLNPNDRAMVERAIAIFVKQLDSPRLELSEAAASALGQNELPSDLANDALMQSLKSDAAPEVVEFVIQAFVRRGKASVRRVASALFEPGLQSRAVQILSRIGPDAADAVPSLLRLFQETQDVKLQQEVVFALGAIGKASADATPALMEALKQESKELQTVVCYSLGRIGPDASDANPMLLELADSSDHLLRIAALWGLVKVNPGNEEIAKFAVPHLLSTLDDERPTVRAEMARLLGELGKPAIAAVTQLKELGQSDLNQAVREAATEALKKIKKPMAKVPTP